MSQPPIYTIGYGRLPITDFINRLQEQEIGFLIDVRSQPYSRYKPEFSKDALKQQLDANGIKYVFMGDTLGGRPSDPMFYNGDNKIDYVKLSQAPFYQQGIGRLQKAHEQKLAVAIMCAEAKPEQCHRTNLIGSTLTELNIPVCHIDENNQLLTQAEVQTRQKALAKMPTDTPHALLKRIFGYDRFRPLQEEIIAHALNKQDALAIMPTGSGKSICYQLPALIFEGLTVVVSPLISLMEDQVAQLQQVGVTAVYLNSTLSPEEYRHTIANILSGATKLLYLAPETLVKPEIATLLSQVQVDCLTIDEAHCISEWGHDFRPEYRQLIAIRQQLPDAVCIAVTATATDRVREDIKTNLDITDAGEFIASFNRENLFLAVEPKQDGLLQAVTFINDHKGEAGIVYCATRKQVDVLTEFLQGRGWPALPYHAGLDDATRRHNQRRFIHEEAIIMVATVAFGMGINKSNVRYILHYDLPKNLESYYQQIGRAGRDGLRADCLLLFSYSDVQTINYFINQEADEQQLGSRMRLDAMLAFAEATQCRRRPLLDYFGEQFNKNDCETCDNCTAEAGDLIDITEPAQKFLSCVLRTGQYFGTTHIIDVLRGSKAQKIIEKNHHNLSTYNIGTEFSKKEWQFLARQFIQRGLLVQNSQYGSLQLTEAGTAVLQNGAKVEGTLMAQPRSISRQPAQSINHDAQLFALLRNKRTELAQAADVPPYIIFSDRSLVEMAATYPQSPYALGQLYGIGQAKVEKYADEFLPIIQTYCEENDIGDRQPETAVTQRPLKPASNRTTAVVNLFNDGKSINEIAKLYDVKQSTVLTHLWKGVQDDKALRSYNFLTLSQLPEDAQQLTLAAFAEHGTTALRPIYDVLDETVSYDELHILRLHFICNKMNLT